MEWNRIRLTDGVRLNCRGVACERSSGIHFPFERINQPNESVPAKLTEYHRVLIKRWNGDNSILK